jgi:hypothetical protein
VLRRATTGRDYIDAAAFCQDFSGTHRLLFRATGGGAEARLVCRIAV